MPRSTASLRSRLSVAFMPRLAMAVLLSSCATAGEPSEGVDASLKEPLPPDASPGNEPYSGTLYVRGSFNDFGLDDPFTHEGNNQYLTVVSLTVGSHALQIADEELSADATFAVAADRDTAIALDTPTKLVPVAGQGGNILLFVPQTGAYRFALSATDRTAPVLLVSLESIAPYREALYVRGSFNDFDTSAPLAYEGLNRYGATLELPAGSHGFKIADEFFSDGTTFSLSATEAATLLLDTPAPLTRAPGTDNDTVLELAEGGAYRFELIASNLEAPVLQVSLVKPAGAPGEP